MRRIDITPYETKPLGAPDPIQIVPFDLLIEVLSAGRFTPKQLLERMELTKKVQAFAGQSQVLLEEADFKALNSAIDTVDGFTVVHGEFIRRVVGAEQVDLAKGDV